jgi:prepilin-type N-terminal cleavage/methylation domain-containing protein
MVQRRHISPQKRPTTRAFTLVELMFVLVIFGIVGMALTSLLISSTRSMLWCVNKSMITNDFRKFTGLISRDALNASHAYLYPSFTPGVVSNPDNRREQGLSGDCLVLVSTVPLPDDINSERYYQRIVIYYRQNGSASDRPVFRTQIDFPTTPPSIRTTTTLEQILSNNIGSFDPPEQVLELSTGLSEDRLFYRATREAFLINGEIIHGNKVQQITNTYNLTISTRG